MSRFLVKKLSEHAILPKRGSAGAAGYDLSAAYDTVIPARGKGIVKTDIAMSIPSDMYGRIAPRSGLAWKKVRSSDERIRAWPSRVCPLSTFIPLPTALPVPPRMMPSRSPGD